MQNNNRKVFETFISRTKIYLAIILVLLIIMCVENNKLIITSIIVYLAIVGYTYYANRKRKSEISETLQDLTLTVDSAAKTSLINSPFPLIIMETDGNIIWKSSKFNSEFMDVDINSYMNDLSIELRSDIESREDKKNRDIVRQITIGNRIYKIIGRYVDFKNKDRDKKGKKEYMIILHFIDDTENVKLQKEYKDSKSCVGIIMVDNYEETIRGLDASEKPIVTAEIDKKMYDWASLTNGVLIKSDRDRYVYLFEQRYLETLKEDKFSILDKIKEIDTKEKVQFTLSIAVSNEGLTDKQKYESAQGAMDVVLGRGGDQAVIRENEIYKFFGGRAEEVEKRTKVKARVVAHALENLIKESKKVMIMGHNNPDMDSIGSCMGIYRLAKTLDTNAYIVSSEDVPALKAFNRELDKDSEYEDVIINKEVAMENVDEDTLLVVVDTHKVNYVDAPELLKEVKKIVIVDHHRRSADYIENATLMFQEVYASSAAELVTELLQYAETKINLKTIEAESLYAGIMMDTKNFTFKTGVRTFEAAAYLRRCGVDIIRVKKWFQSDLKSFNTIADIVKRADIVNTTIAISIYDKTSKEASLICAKAADELLTISDITASFVLGNTGEKICISGRSIGDINVQVILEKLGGGGHITLAGAQVEGMTIEETKQELINRINEYFSEIEN
ncbi:MAG: DHH family phosphoesterase [Clostridia bacterium]|jgi:c-di-AMP phosphodiesterase-like protein|nr:DHH family phosphoesterase [Sebaldella sp.]CDC05893.1 putative signaling protein consisting of a modified GGDEF domain and a DHH domain protein [Clostridium sp. CAG:343]